MDLRSTHTDENRCGRVIFDGASAASRKPALSEVEGDLQLLLLCPYEANRAGSIVEIRGLPGLKIETWGTQLFHASDTGHLPIRREAGVSTPA
jgi:hypothetical protein